MSTADVEFKEMNEERLALLAKADKAALTSREKARLTELTTRIDVRAQMHPGVRAMVNSYLDDLGAAADRAEAIRKKIEERLKEKLKENGER